jgi:hypothetical protein
MVTEHVFTIQNVSVHEYAIKLYYLFAVVSWNAIA